jgi:hypothetical protein
LIEAVELNLGNLAVGCRLAPVMWADGYEIPGMKSDFVSGSLRSPFNATVHKFATIAATPTKVP